MGEENKIRATTILCVRRDSSVIMGADSQVSRGSLIMKNNAVKITKLKDPDVLIGIAGSVADGLEMKDLIEIKLKAFHNPERASYEFMKQLRDGKYNRPFEAELILASKEYLAILSGTGVIFEPQDKDIVSIGSGGHFALSAAKALYENTKLNPKDIVLKSMKIASSLCIYTNDNIIIEEI